MPAARKSDPIWERIRDATTGILSEYSIADLLEREPQAAAGRYVI